MDWQLCKAKSDFHVSTLIYKTIAVIGLNSLLKKES